MKRGRPAYDLALGEAATEGNLKLVHALLGAGADVNASGNGVDTPLISAVKNGHTRVAAKLLDAGASLFYPSVHGTLALMLAIVCKHPDIVKLIVARPDVAVDRGMRDMAMLQHPQCYNSYLGHDLTDTPLNAAARAGVTRTIEILLHAGAKVNSRGGGGFTPLDVACQNRKADAVATLLRAGADANGASSKPTPLEHAIISGDTIMAEMLLEAGVDVELGSPLTTAIVNSRSNIVALLLKHGVDISRADDWNTSPLHSAMHTANVRIATMLAEAGARVAERYEDTVEVNEEMRSALFQIVALRQIAFLCGTHARLGETSPVRLLVGFEWIIDFVIGYSLPGWAIPPTRRDKMPELM
jgi:ankyrin repeat protein